MKCHVYRMRSEILFVSCMANDVELWRRKRPAPNNAAWMWADTRAAGFSGFKQIIHVSALSDDYKINCETC